MRSNSGSGPISILMADDDADDRMLARDALEECRLANHLYFVEDGEELLDFLKRRGRFTDPSSSPRPGIVLLDLNMPRKSGSEALREIKTDPDLCCIPVVVLTTSHSEADIMRSYELGANSYISKPVTFDGLVDVMKSLKHYWFEVVAVPHDAVMD